ncbi:MAG: hypothetical protein LCH67_08215 [Bacteroidetes bacterium]|nr:hypothetical protein [Bacteroidota bacterium]
MYSQSSLENLLNKCDLDLEELKNPVFCYVPKEGLEDDIFLNRKIVPKHCKVMDREVIYFGYGKSNYKPIEHQVDNREVYAPITLIFDGETINLDNITDIYVYDTGALNHPDSPLKTTLEGIYTRLTKNKFYKWNIKKENLSKAVKLLFDSYYNYIYDIPNPIIESKEFPHFNSYLSQLMNYHKEKKGDVQLSNFEIIVDKEVPFQPIAIIYPDVTETSAHSKVKLDIPSNCIPIPYNILDNGAEFEGITLNELYNPMRKKAKTTVIKLNETK